MKKLRICLILVYFVFGTYCFAQSNNDAQRIVGTWVFESGVIAYVFNSNGTFSSQNYGSGKYFVCNGKILTSTGDIYTFYLSIDGKILFLQDEGRVNGKWYYKQ